jgi:hypothetical protein
MSSRLSYSLCAGLFASVVVCVSCSGQNTVSSSVPTNAKPVQNTTAIPQASERTLSLHKNDPGCPQTATHHLRPLCYGTPTPSPRPSPTPTATPTPKPSPTPLPTAPPKIALGVGRLSNPGLNFWGYVVTTTGSHTYYFPPHSAATFNSSTKTLVVRGYLETFTWPLSKVTGVLHFGQTVNPSSFQDEADSPLFSDVPGDEDCTVDPDCAIVCPDCEYDPTNPDGCEYGTDPFTGGCIGTDGIEIIFVKLPGYLAYCTKPYALGCFAYGGLNFIKWPRNGCTVSYTYYPDWLQTWNICNLPLGAAHGISEYYDETGENGTVEKDFTSDNTTFDACFEPAETENSETDTLITNANNVPIQFGYAFHADIGAAPPYGCFN